jgi:hypothetical protein
MAQLATGAVGAVIGYFASGGNPAGAYWGWTIGVAVGTILFPPDGQDQIGPRLGDREIQTSTYGVPIPVVWGTMRTAGNIIWATEIVEKTHVEKVGGKGGPTSTNTTYSYYGNFAVGVCEGEAQIVRMWANGKLIFDQSIFSPQPVEGPELNFTWYTGSETQLPDPLIESVEGVGQVPGHRGMAYIVFDEMPLKNYGNGIPNLTFEVTRNLVGSAFSDTHGTNAGYESERSVPIWDRAIVVNAKPVDATDTVGIHELQFWNLQDMTTTEVLANNLTSINLALEGGSPSLRIDVGALPSGNLVYEVDDADSANWYFIEINPSTLYEDESKRVLSTGAHVASGSKSCTRVGFNMGHDEFIFWTTSTGKGRTYRSGFGHVGPADSDIDPGADAVMVPMGGLLGGRTGGWLGFVHRASPGGFFLLKRIDTTTLEVTQWTLTRDQIDSGNYDYDVKIIKTIDIAEVDAGWTSFSAAGTHKMMRDWVDFSLVIMVGSLSPANEQRFIKLDVESKSIVWVSDLINFGSTLTNASMSTFSILKDGRFGWISDDEKGYLMDTATGEFNEVNTGYSPEAAGEIFAYNSEWNMVVDGYNEVFYVGRSVGLPTTVQEITNDVVSRVGLAPADVDTTALTSMSLPGYTMSRNMQARAALEPLAQIFLFDVVEVDDILDFIPRGGAAAGTINEQDMVVPRNESGSLVETRAAETELPAEISISYANPSDDYNQATHRAKLILTPFSEVDSSNKANLQVAAALNGDFVKEQVKKILIANWEERISRTFVMSNAYLKYIPSDVLTITLDDGRTVRTRLIAGEVGRNLDYSATSVQEDSSQYSASEIADSGSGVPGQTVPAATNLTLLAVHSPLLRDFDDVSRTHSSYYYFMAPVGLGELSLGLLYESADGESYDLVGSSTQEPTWGYATNSLGDVSPEAKWVQDNDNTLNVRLQNEIVSLSSVTFDQMITGTTNAFALIHGNGDVEILKFQTVVAEGDGTFTLSGLARGRRGTDPFTGGHVVGDVFIMLGVGGNIGTTTLGNIGANRNFKTIASGSFLEDAIPLQENNPGYDLKPYAPVWVESDGSLWGTDIVLSWTRRTRVGGELRNLTGTVPVSEDSEEYEVEIYDGLTLERTFTGLTTPTVTYTSAQQTADAWSGTPSEISVIVYQISGQVGRGFPSYKTVIPV